MANSNKTSQKSKTQNSGKTKAKNSDASVPFMVDAMTPDQVARVKDPLAGALEYLRAGLSIVPIKANSKSPSVTWTAFQKVAPTEDQVKQWFKQGKAAGIGVVCGKVSGNLELLDLESIAPLEIFAALVEQRVPGLLARLPRSQTPSGGRHLFYRCERIGQNQKLAIRALEIKLDDVIEEEDGKGKILLKSNNGESVVLINEKPHVVKTLIETRGEGGQFLSPLCPAGVHPNGGVYKILNGDLLSIPTITKEERQVLFECARACNEYIRPADVEGATKQITKSGDLKPGDDYNQRGNVRDLLRRHGWKYHSPHTRGENWSRPGVTDHCGATLFNDGLLFVYSSNAEPLQENKPYSAFGLYGWLEHDGDFKKAARALGNEGYGTKPKDQTQIPDVPDALRVTVGKIKFHVSKSNGVWAQLEDDESNPRGVCVSSAIFIDADTRDVDNQNWGRRLRLYDRDSVEHIVTIPMQMLAGDGKEVKEILLNRGVDINRTKHARGLLETYLGANPKVRARCVPRIGWHDQAFILPDISIGTMDGEPVYLQTESGSNHLLKASGTLDDWKESIGQYCIGNTRLVFATSVAFAASLLEPLRGESGGFHLTGRTSKGKTTIEYVACSVWGGDGKDGFLRGWRATANGLEYVSEYHNDSLLCLDEIGQCDPREIGAVAYMLANGQGKIRGAKAGGIRDIAQWRLLFISSGEVSLEAMIANGGGRRIQGGQLVRFVNLEADAGRGMGVFETIHDFKKPEKFAQHLKLSSLRHYGTPIRSFLEAIINKRMLSSLRQSFKSHCDKFESHHLNNGHSEVVRVLDRFALVSFAGELASELAITGWPELVTYTRVFKPQIEGTYYYLIFGTNHIEGIRVFRNVEKDFAKEQEDIRYELMNPHPTLFNRGTGLFNSYRNKKLEDAKNLLIELLQQRRTAKFEIIESRLLTLPFVWGSDLQEILQELKSNNLISVPEWKPKQKNFKKGNTIRWEGK